jgi:hypothetical protein
MKILKHYGKIGKRYGNFQEKYKWLLKPQNPILVLLNPHVK